MRSSLLFCLAVGLATACGDPIHASDDLGPPLALLQARISGPAPEALSTERLRAGLIWAAVDEQPYACRSEQGSLVCSSAPWSFGAGGSSNVVPVAPVFPSAFEIPIHALPDSHLLAIGVDGLFGFAELVLFDDGNQNGELDLVAADALVSADTVVATTGSNPLERSFVLYREGALTPAWQLFAAHRCNEPPVGFSIARFDAEGCWVGDAVLPIQFDAGAEVRSLLCVPAEARSTFPEFPPPPEAEVDCESNETLHFIIDPDRYCPEEQRYELSGCDSDPLCREPEWDLRDAPPSWWPCGEDTVP